MTGKRETKREKKEKTEKREKRLKIFKSAQIKLIFLKENLVIYWHKLLSNLNQITYE